MLTPAIWTAIFREQTLAEALRSLSAGGWRCFEISTEHLDQLEEDPEPQERVAEIRETLAELGAVAPQAHAHLTANVAHPDAAQRRNDLERLERHLDLAAQLGVKNVVIHPGRGQGYTTRKEYRRILKLNRESFIRLGDRAGELGMKIGLENMADNRSLAGGRTFGAAPRELLELLEEISHSALGVTIDTSHANLQGLDIPAAIREFGGWICGTHISDNDGSGDQHLTPGSGAIDWPAVMAAFKDSGYEGIFNLEIPGERHPTPALQELKLRHAREVAEWLVEQT